MVGKYIRLGVSLLKIVKKHFDKPLRSGEVINGRTFAGRALLCYLTLPLKTKHLDHTHSNLNEVRVMVELLSDMGWEVWVVNYNSEYPINYNYFSLIIGFGRAFDRSFYSDEYYGKRIFFLTGANPCYSSKAEIMRIHDLKIRQKKSVAPRRTVFEPWIASAILADAIFYLGNSWTLSTIDGLNPNILRIPVPYVHTWDKLELVRDYNNAKKKILWFGSEGAVHKGLDLILESMDLLGNKYCLHICGPVENEEDFITIYSKYFSSMSNIKYHGFVDVRGEDMKIILEDCAFVVLPSCSEGGGSSVLTCMHAGLIPIVTRESSVDIEDFGFYIDDPSPEGIAEVVRKAAELSNEELNRRSEDASNMAQVQHSIQSYKNAFCYNLRRIIE